MIPERRKSKKEKNTMKINIVTKWTKHDNKLISEWTRNRARRNKVKKKCKRIIYITKQKQIISSSSSFIHHLSFPFFHGTIIVIITFLFIFSSSEFLFWFIYFYRHVSFPITFILDHHNIFVLYNSITFSSRKCDKVNMTKLT